MSVQRWPNSCPLQVARICLNRQDLEFQNWKNTVILKTDDWQHKIVREQHKPISVQCEIWWEVNTYKMRRAFDNVNSIDDLQKSWEFTNFSVNFFS